MTNYGLATALMIASHKLSHPYKIQLPATVAYTEGTVIHLWGDEYTFWYVSPWGWAHWDYQEYLETYTKAEAGDRMNNRVAGLNHALKDMQEKEP